MVRDGKDYWKISFPLKGEAQAGTIGFMSLFFSYL